MLMVFLSDIHGNRPALEAAADGDARPAYARVYAARGAPPPGRRVRFEYDRDRTIAALDKTSPPRERQKDFVKGTQMRFWP